MAMCLRDQFARGVAGNRLGQKVKTGERFYGTWMQDGRFYYPMSQPDGGVVICSGGTDEFGPIIEE